jgi:phosphonate transport system substrate-binding protein
MNSVFRLLKGFIFLVASSQIAVAESSSESRFTEWLHTLSFPVPNTSNVLYQPSFSKKSPFSATIYHVGIHPLHNPKHLFEIYAPLIDLFNAAIPDASFVLEASRNYDEFDKKLYASYFDFALPNPYQTVNALKHGYHVFAKMGDDENFRGIILVRKDSHIKQISDLKGKTVAYPAPTALAATLMPQYYLHTHGLNINEDIENRYVGSQESSIMNVLNGEVAAGATWPVPWNAFVQKNPQLAEQLEVKWETEPLLNNSWVAKETVAPAMIYAVKNILLNLQQTEHGKDILASIPISKFETANDATYDPIKTFITTFNQTVRPLDN